MWDGTHPNELKARECGKSLEVYPIGNVARGVANILGCLYEKRWIDVNMTEAYPGNPNSPFYEERRAAEVLEESRGFYTVIDHHNMNYFGENTAIIDLEMGVSPVILGWLYALGIRNLVLTHRAGIHGFIPNSFALETLAAGLGGDTQALREAFDRLANDPLLPHASVTNFRWFNFFGSVHKDQADPDCISYDQRKVLRGFDPIPGALAEAMGLTGQSVHFLGGSYEPNEMGYWADLVIPTTVPDDTWWPSE